MIEQICRWISNGKVDERGVAHTTEALIAVIFLLGVVIAASASVPLSDPYLTTEDREKQVAIQGNLDQMVQQSIEDGTLKSSILNWDDDNRRFAYAGGLQDNNGLYLEVPESQFGDRLDEFRDEHNVSVSIELIPAANSSQPAGNASTLRRAQPDSIPFLSTGSAGQTMVVSGEYLTLHGNDRLQSPPENHRTGNSPSQIDRGTKALADSNSYPVPSAKDSTSTDEIYNVVYVRVVVWF
jgi:hypothetical protein